jgi:hypothetical protein
MGEWLREPAFVGAEECQDWLKIFKVYLFWESLMAKYPLHPIWITDLTLNIAEISEEELRKVRRMVKILPQNVPDKSLFFTALASARVSIKDFKVNEVVLNQIFKEVGQEYTQEQTLEVLQDFSKKLGKGVFIPTYLGAMCLAAYRSTDWLGLGAFNSQFWIYAFSGGKLNPCWPFPSPSMEKYAQGYTYLEEFKDIVRNVPCQGRMLSDNELEYMLTPNEDGEFKNKFGQFDCNATHPLHKLIGRTKFKGLTLWSAEKVAKIDEDTTACLEGRKSIEELVVEEILKEFASSEKKECRPSAKMGHN